MSFSVFNGCCQVCIELLYNVIRVEGIDTDGCMVFPGQGKTVLRWSLMLFGDPDSFLMRFNFIAKPTPTSRLYFIPSGVCIYPTPLLWAGCDRGSSFKSSKAGLNSVFLLIWLFYQGQRTQSALQFAYSLEEKRWICAFLKWNSLVQVWTQFIS